MHRLCRFALPLLAASLLSRPASGVVPLARGTGGARVINVAAKGTRFSPGVRGLALSDVTIDRTAYRIATPDTLAVSDGSALRGVAGGLYADLYDWRTRNNQPRPPTLEFLRWARDHRANLFLTVNTRGLVVPDPDSFGKTKYVDTDTATLAHLAADWVHYANRIVPRYRQGSTITDPRDAAILKSLRWSSDAPGDRFDTLLKPGEKPVSRVTYWEIGNEPTVGVSGGIGVSNGYKLSVQEYHDRYRAIAAAMKAEDPRIKVGPCITNTTGEGKHLEGLLRDKSVPVDFISYHPYQKLGARATIPKIESYLDRSVAAGQERFYRRIVDLVRQSGRDPAKIGLVASEVFVSNWPYNDTVKEGEMAHALGTVETIFTFARLGLAAAHYWIWPSNQGDGTKYPVYKAFEKLRDAMGDTLLDAYAEKDFRLYTTRDGATGKTSVWALNFSDSKDTTLALSLRGLTGKHTITQYTLGATSGKTSLLSANLSPSQPGGPKSEVDWTEKPLPGADPSNLRLTFPAATITLLKVD